MHDAIHPRSGGLRSCGFGSVPELRGFVQLPLYYLIAGQIFKIEWIAQGLEDSLVLHNPSSILVIVEDWISIARVRSRMRSNRWSIIRAA